MHYEEDTAECVQLLDGLGITGFVYNFNLCEYHGCLYFNSFQHIYRLNPSELSEEERTFHPGRRNDLADDSAITITGDLKVGQS